MSAHGAGITSLLLQFSQPSDGDVKYSGKSEFMPDVTLFSHIARALADNQEGDAPLIPSGAVYLGQMMAHDALRTEHEIMPLKTPRSNRIRRPLMLDSIYGDGPDIAPHLFDSKTEEGLRPRFRYGAMLGTIDKAPDLPRHRGGCPLHYQKSPGALDKGEPLVADRRNDSHLIISQFVGVWMRLHNHIYDDMSEELVNKLNGQKHAHRVDFRFRVTQDAVRNIWHSVIENDIFPYLLHPAFRGPKYQGDCESTAPPPGALLALRSTHSLVRSRYKFVSSKKLSILKEFGIKGIESSPRDLRKILATELHEKLDLHKDEWAISWEEFFDILFETKASNRAKYKLFYARQLTFDALRAGFVFEDKHLNSLMLADLLRSKGFEDEISSEGSQREKDIVAELRGDAALDTHVRAQILQRFKTISSQTIGGPDPEWMVSQEELKTSTLPLHLLILGEAEKSGGQYLGRNGSALLSPWLHNRLKAARNSISVDESIGASLPRTFGCVLETLGLIQKNIPNETT